MCRIIASVDSGAEHVFVARELSFCADASCCKPDPGMEPVHRAAKLRDELCKAVVSFYVRELVKKNNATSFIIPFGCIGRQQNDVIHYAPG
jgi:hypothetical protein